MIVLPQATYKSWRLRDTVSIGLCGTEEQLPPSSVLEAEVLGRPCAPDSGNCFHQK